MGGTKTQPEQLEARGGRDTTCFPASMASGEERNSQLSLAFPAPAEPHDPHSSGPKCQHQPFRAPRLLVSHFPFCSPNPGLKGNNYFFLNMLGVFFFPELPFYFLTFFLANSLGFPGGSEGKESICKAGDPSFIPRLGRPLEVIQSCPTLCNPMDCSMPGFPVLHHLLEPAQTHVH